MSIAAFAQYLHASKERVLERWLDAVRREAVAAARDLPEPQILNDVPEILEEIVQAIAADPPEAGVDPEGRAHGRQRWGSGYRIDELLRELAILHDAIVALLETPDTGRPRLNRADEAEVRRRIRRVIDRSSQVAAAQFHTEALAARRLLEEELRTANEQKDRFLALLSHELRNPLAPILTAVQLLEFAETSDLRLRRAREIIERQVRHQTRLIDDLLDITRITRGKIALRQEQCDLKSVLAGAIDACSPAIRSKGLELQVELAAEPIWVEGDCVRLEQVVVNLLQNAIRYTPPGGALCLTLRSEGDMAVVTMRDNGVGIEPAMLPRIFDLFVQADSSPDRPQGGLGLGLTLVKNLVTLHGGTVEARSDGPGRGSEFEVRLPIAPAVPAPDVLLTRVSARSTIAPRRVAIVEDDTDTRTSLAELLELFGHQVFTAADSPEALQLMEQEQPEVFVIDIGLPGMDGYELARALRRLPASGNAFLIAATGYGSPEEQERAQEAGFDAHLTKPVLIDELVAHLSAFPINRSTR
jgi:signal transduction histidine kinase/ActR/RegA family two-component response regulator